MIQRCEHSGFQIHKSKLFSRHMPQAYIFFKNYKNMFTIHVHISSIEFVNVLHYLCWRGQGWQWPPVWIMICWMPACLPSLITVIKSLLSSCSYSVSAHNYIQVPATSYLTFTAQLMFILVDKKSPLAELRPPYHWEWSRLNWFHTMTSYEMDLLPSETDTKKWWSV